MTNILIYDIETAPLHGATAWKRWDTDLLGYQDWYILSVAWKWLGEKATYVSTLPSVSQTIYRADPTDDIRLAQLLRDMFDAADITVTHNGKVFDRPKAQTRMIYHDLVPPSPHKQIDTCQIAKRQFAFTSNSLKDLASFLKLPAKSDPGGIKTWYGCMAGDPKSWAKMARYNRQDVLVTEQLYLRLRPWVQSHPNVAMFEDGSCPRCGTEGTLTKRGYTYAGVTRRTRYQCRACWGYSTSRTVQKGTNAHVPE